MEIARSGCFVFVCGGGERGERGVRLVGRAREERGRIRERREK